jgi:hypothetical protein
MTGQPRPTLSVIVGIVSDTGESRVDINYLRACLDALSAQLDGPSVEVIVPYHEAVDGIEDLKRTFPWVMFVPVTLGMTSRHSGEREHHDILRARGLAAARGDVVGLLEDHALPDRHWCTNVIAAHRKNFAAIGGAIENGVDRPLNWAVYYCDFGRYQNPLIPGESSYASDANVTYKRSSLESVRSTWENSFREVVVNAALMSKGEKVALQPDVIVYQNRQGLRLGRAVHERFIWGRSYAATRTAMLSRTQRILYAALSPVLPAILLLRMTMTAWSRHRHFREYIQALPLIALLVAVWSLGEGLGYVMGVRSQAPDGST